MAKVKQEDSATLAKKAFRAKESGKRAYARADRFLDQLIKRGAQPGEEILDEAGTPVAKIVDNFAEKNVSYKPCGVRRFELKEVNG